MALFTSGCGISSRTTGRAADGGAAAGGENGGRRMNVIETTGLGKRYGKAWALRDCTLAVPEGAWPRSSARTARASPR